MLRGPQTPCWLAPAYEPDAAVLAFYEGNDYTNNGDAPRRRTIDDGYLRDLPQPQSKLKQTLTTHSIIATLVNAQLESVANKRKMSHRIVRTEQWLTQLHERAVAHGIPLVVLVIPDQDPEVYTRSRLLRAYDRLLGGMDAAEARRRVQALCEERGIAYCRLSPRFEADPGAEALRLKDTHFNTAGHRAAGEELAVCLRQAGVAP